MIHQNFIKIYSKMHQIAPHKNVLLCGMQLAQTQRMLDPPPSANLVYAHNIMYYYLH